MPQGLLYDGVPWWPWHLQVNPNTLNAKRRAGKCNKLWSTWIIMVHHNYRFNLVWQSVVLFSENLRQTFCEINELQNIKRELNYTYRVRDTLNFGASKNNIFLNIAHMGIYVVQICSLSTDLFVYIYIYIILELWKKNLKKIFTFFIWPFSRAILEI